MKAIIKATLILFFVLTTFYITTAQIAINSDGTLPDASAMLEVSSSDKGILVPRMTTTERTAISSPATGLLVYDTDFNTFWYYANSMWNNLSNTILADADNDTKIQVEESSDDDIIRFDLGGTESLTIERNTNGATLLSLPNNARNIIIGTGAGQNLDPDLSGATFGDANSFIGTNAGYSMTLGSHNVFLGRSAGYSNVTGDSNIFLGNSSGYNETGSNKLYIDNNSTTTPLIYGEFDNDLLQINGTLNINGAFAFPTVDGTVSQVLGN